MWSDEDVVMAQHAAEAAVGKMLPADLSPRARTMFRAVMTKAAELLAARGETMTAEELNLMRSGTGNDLTGRDVERLLGAVLSQGARLAVVENGLAETREMHSQMCMASAGHQRRAEESAEAMRAACLDAALERLIREGYTENDFVWALVKAAIEGAAP